MVRSRVLLWCAVFALSASAQPVVSSVVNAASNRVSQLPFSGIARGAIAVAYGSGLGPATLVQVSAYPLRNTLAGTTAVIRIGGADMDAPMLYTSAGQVAFIVPSRTPAGTAELRITYNGQASAAAQFAVVESNLAIFTWTQNGNGQAVSTDGVTNRTVSLEAPAKPDDILNIWATGLGPAPGDEATAPTPGNLTLELEALVGSRRAEIVYRGRSGCCSALDQVVIRIPRDTVFGCSVPIYFRSAAFVSNVIPMPISADGSPCADPLEDSSLTIAGKDRVKVGSLLLDRVNDRSASGSTQVLDFAHFVFLQYEKAYYNNYRGLQPAAGTCFVAQYDQNSRFDPAHAALLNAGSQITLTLQGTTFPLPRDDFGGYGQFFQGRNPNDFSGTGTLSGPGGPDVASFSISHTTPAFPSFQWREWTALSDIPTGQALTLSWTGSAADGFVDISGQTSGTLYMEFSCRVPGSESQFVIPADIMRLIPPGAGFLAISLQRPSVTSGKPASLDAFSFGRSIRFSRAVTFR